MTTCKKNFSVANVFQKHMNELFSVGTDAELKSRCLKILNEDAVGKCPEEARLRAIDTISKTAGSRLRGTVTTWILGEKVI